MTMLDVRAAGAGLVGPRARLAGVGDDAPRPQSRSRV